MEDTIHQLSFQLIQTLNGSLSQFNVQNPTLGDMTLQILLHIVSCTSALRDIIESQKGKNSDIAQYIYNPFLNGILGSFGKFIMDTLSSEPNASEAAAYTTCYQITFRHLLRLFPELSNRKHKHSGKLLLHHVVLKARASQALDSIRLTLAIAPESAKSRDSAGALALHWAMKNDHLPPDCIDLLAQSYPMSLQTADHKGFLPLHWAVNTDTPPMDLIRRLLKLFPKAASVPSSTGNLVLHYSVARDFPHIELVKLLLSVYPDAVRHKCSEGNLPVHRLLARNNPDFEVLQLLVKAFPEGLMVSNVQQQTPLHMALDHSHPPRITSYLIAQGPLACAVQDMDGYYPLHMVLDQVEPDYAIAEQIFTAHPQAATVPTHDNLLPFHMILSVNNSPTIRTLAMLLKVMPNAVNMNVIELVPASQGGVMLGGDSWSGEWVEKEWKPLDRARERGLDRQTIAFLEDVLRNPKVLDSYSMQGAAIGVGGAALAPLSLPPVQKFVPLQNNTTSITQPISFTAFNNNSSSSVPAYALPVTSPSFIPSPVPDPIPEKTYTEVEPFQVSVQHNNLMASTAPLPEETSPQLFSPTTTIRPASTGWTGTGGVGVVEAPPLSPEPPVMVGNFTSPESAPAVVEAVGGRGAPPQGPIPTSLLQAAESNAMRLSRAQYDFLKGGKKISKKKKKIVDPPSSSEPPPTDLPTISPNNQQQTEDVRASTSPSYHTAPSASVSPAPAPPAPVASPAPDPTNVPTSSPLDEPISPAKSKKPTLNPQQFIKKGTKVVVSSSGNSISSQDSAGGQGQGGQTQGISLGSRSNVAVIAPLETSIGSKSYATNNTVEIMKTLGGKVQTNNRVFPLNGDKNNNTNNMNNAGAQDMV